MLITALTSVLHLSPPSAAAFQSMPPHQNSWSSYLILSSHFSCSPCSVLHSPVTSSLLGQNVFLSTLSSTATFINTMIMFIIAPSSDSSVSTVTWPRDEQLTRNHSIPDRGKTFLSSPKRLDWLSGPPRLILNGHREEEFVLRWQSGRSVGAWSWPLIF